MLQRRPMDWTHTGFQSSTELKISNPAGGEVPGGEGHGDL